MGNKPKLRTEVCGYNLRRIKSIMKKIGIIAKDIPAARTAARKLTAWLERRGKKVYPGQ